MLGRVCNVFLLEAKRGNTIGAWSNPFLKAQHFAFSIKPLGGPHEGGGHCDSVSMAEGEPVGKRRQPVPLHCLLKQRATTLR